MILACLRSHLLDDEDIAGALGDAVHPSHLPQGVTTAAVLHLIDTVHDEDLDGDTGHCNARVQVDVFAATLLAADRIARQARKRLLAAHGEIDAGDAGSVVVDGVSTASGIRHLTDPPIDGSDDWRHRATFDVFVSYSDSSA